MEARRLGNALLIVVVIGAMAEIAWSGFSWIDAVVSLIVVLIVFALLRIFMRRY